MELYTPYACHKIYIFLDRYYLSFKKALPTFEYQSQRKKISDFGCYKVQILSASKYLECSNVL